MKKDTRTQHARQAERGSLSDLGKLLGEVANPTAPVPLPTFAVAGLPAAADYPGCVVFCSNGAGGDPILAVSDGTNWKRSDTGGNVAAS